MFMGIQSTSNSTEGLSSLIQSLGLIESGTNIKAIILIQPEKILKNNWQSGWRYKSVDKNEWKIKNASHRILGKIYLKCRRNSKSCRMVLQWKFNAFSNRDRSTITILPGFKGPF